MKRIVLIFSAVAISFTLSAQSQADGRSRDTDPGKEKGSCSFNRTSNPMEKARTKDNVTRRECREYGRYAPGGSRFTPGRSGANQSHTNRAESRR